MRYFENVVFWISDFKMIELLVSLILFAVIVWAISVISCLLVKACSVFKKFWNEIKENEKQLKKIGAFEDKIKTDNSKEEKKNEKEQYEQAIRRILDSESLLMVGKYLT